MAGQKQPIDLIVAKGKKHLTKAEIEARRSSEPDISEVSKITIPEYLPDGLKKEFKEISDKLLVVGIFSELDEDALARYLLAKQKYIAFEALLNEAIANGDIDEIKDLSLLQCRAFEQCHKSAAALGMTITSRCKITLPKTQEVEEPKNKFAAFEKVGS